jgi:hypothetical protein
VKKVCARNKLVQVSCCFLGVLLRPSADVGLEIEIALESSFVALLPQRRPLSAALEAIHNK